MHLLAVLQSLWEYSGRACALQVTVIQLH